jgi:hypothetical protein
MTARLGRFVTLLAGLLLLMQLSGEPVRAALQASSVSISMSNPACVQALPANGMCSIQMDTLVASASDPSFSRLEVLVNGKLRVVMSAFFESSAYLSFPMTPGGLKVACGSTNEGGLPDYGKVYTLTANAYMADGNSATNSASVYCPAFDGNLYLPLIRKN